MRVSYIAPAIMYVTIAPNYGDAGYCCTGSATCLFKLHYTSVHNCSTFFLPAAQASLPQGPQTYLPLRMFDYMALDQHTCLKPSSYVCNSFMRLAGMLQYPCFKRCFEPTGMFVAVAPDHLARRLQCLLELHLPADMFESVATN